MAVQCRFRENEEFFRDYRTEKTPLFRIEPDAADLLKMQMELDAMDRAEGRLHVQRDQRYLENVAIHSLIADRMVDHDVLVMHGSALCMDGEAYIFIASSGTGKSTHARFWREVFGDRVWMLNDDKPMLRFMEDQVLVCGTPWDGKHHLSRNAYAPLKAVVHLTRDEKNYIEPMSKADAFQLLLKHAFLSNKGGNRVRIMELEKKLLMTADFYKLGCNQSREAAETAWAGMNRK